MSSKHPPSNENQTSYYRSNFFKDLQVEVVETAKECELYGELCKTNEFDFSTSITYNNLESVPFIPAQFFKNSLGQYYQMLRVPREQVDLWHISSSTSQDPSIVGRTASDIEQIKENWVAAWRQFLFLDQLDYTANFAPSHLAMRMVARRSGAKVKGGRLYLDFINSILDAFTHVNYVVRFKFWKTVSHLLRFRIRTVAELSKRAVLELLQLRKATEGFCLGGNPLLMNRLITTEFQDEEYPLGEYGCVGTGGGGWDGIKAQLKMDEIDKPTFIEDIERVFHIPPERFRDNYTFTETPSAFLGHWSKKFNNFIMHVPPTSMIVVRDTVTLEPVKPGDEGLLEVLTPYGVKGAACVAVLVDDVVEYLGDNKSSCPECGHEGATFIIKHRLKEAPGRSCSSLLTWMEEYPG